MFAVNVFFTSNKKNDQAFLARLGQVLEGLSPSLVRKFGDGLRVNAQFMVDARDVWAAVDTVADLFEGVEVPGLKISYVRCNGYVKQMFPAVDGPRLRGDMPDEAPAARVIAIPVRREATPLRVVEAPVSVEQAMDDARRLVDETLD